MVPFPEYTGKFFHVHARKGKPGFHFHTFLTKALRVPHLMVLFCSSKYTLYGFLAHIVYVLHPRCEPYGLTHVEKFLPDMPWNDLYMIPALSAFWKVWASRTYLSAAFVFPVSVPVSRWIFQYLSVRAGVQVFGLIICVFIFSEESLFPKYHHHSV